MSTSKNQQERKLREEQYNICAEEQKIRKEIKRINSVKTTDISPKNEEVYELQRQMALLSERIYEETSFEEAKQPIKDFFDCIKLNEVKKISDFVHEESFKEMNGYLCRKAMRMANEKEDKKIFNILSNHLANVIINAVKDKRNDIIDKYIVNGHYINLKENKCEAWKKAVEDSNDKAIELLIEGSQNGETKFSWEEEQWGCWALQYACAKQQCDIVDLLIKNICFGAKYFSGQPSSSEEKKDGVKSFNRVDCQANPENFERIIIAAFNYAVSVLQKEKILANGKKWYVLLGENHCFLSSQILNAIWMAAYRKVSDDDALNLAVELSPTLFENTIENKSERASSSGFIRVLQNKDHAIQSMNFVRNLGYQVKPIDRERSYPKKGSIEEYEKGLCDLENRNKHMVGEINKHYRNCNVVINCGASHMPGIVRGLSNKDDVHITEVVTSPHGNDHDENGNDHHEKKKKPLNEMETLKINLTKSAILYRMCQQLEVPSKVVPKEKAVLSLNVNYEIYEYFMKHNPLMIFNLKDDWHLNENKKIFHKTIQQVYSLMEKQATHHHDIDDKCSIMIDKTKRTPVQPAAHCDKLKKVMLFYPNADDKKYKYILPDGNVLPVSYEEELEAGDVMSSYNDNKQSVVKKWRGC